MRAATARPGTRVGRRGYRTLSASLLLCVCITLCGCASRVTVAQVLNDPNRWYGKVVRVHGIAESGVEVAGFTVYSLDDAGARVTVVGHSGEPVTGSSIDVIGRVNGPATLGVVTLGTHVVEDKREVRQ